MQLCSGQKSLRAAGLILGGPTLAFITSRIGAAIIQASDTDQSIHAGAGAIGGLVLGLILACKKPLFSKPENKTKRAFQLIGLMPTVFSIPAGLVGLAPAMGIASNLDADLPTPGVAIGMQLLSGLAGGVVFSLFAISFAGLGYFASRKREPVRPQP